jgi:DNA repair protein SbcC/Rad50
MIPLQLTLKNFLSYSEASLDFEGLHTACICGANGAGKSSLLEGITWAIWGECRAVSEDDAIANGALDVRVDFTFQIHGATCRIIRTRQRGGSASLEFQIQSTDGQFRSLTQKGMKATQGLVNDYLKIDYDTFINSAYLRQGKADEFMLKKPGDRKQILADLLKLDRYEELSDRAKESVKQFKIQIEILERNLATDLAKLEQVEEIQKQQAEVKIKITNLQERETTDRGELEVYKTTARQRDTWQQQLTWEQKRDRDLTQDLDRWQQEIERVKTEQKRLQQLVDRGKDITDRYHQYLALQEQAEVLEGKFQTFQQLKNQQQEWQQQFDRDRQQLKLDLGKIEAELAAGVQQEQEIITILNTAAEVERGMAQLQLARQQLAALDELQQQVSPLLQLHQHRTNEIERVGAKFQARLDELNSRIKQEQTSLDRQPQLRQQLVDLDGQIAGLDKKKVYQKRVEDKGHDKRSQLDRARESQRNYRHQLTELELLKTPGAACPLCDRGLDEEHWQHVLASAKADREHLEQQISIAQQEELTYQQERQNLIDEYKQLNQELANYDKLCEQRGKLQAQLDRYGEIQSNLEILLSEREQLEQAIVHRSYAENLQAELHQLQSQIQSLNYDEQTHALVRGDVTKLQWADRKQALLKDAQNRQEQLHDRQLKLTNQIQIITAKINELETDSPLYKQLQTIAAQLVELNYDRAVHHQLLTDLRQAQPIQLQYQELQQAQQIFPQLDEKLQQLQTSHQEKLTDRASAQLEIERISTEIANIIDPTAKIQSLEQQLTELRQQLDSHLSNLGGLERQLTELANIQTKLSSQQQQLQSSKQQQRIYEELSKAFGKNGIQALIIENVLPQLEVEANQILSRLSNNQLHVQFITQKATKASRTKKANVKNAKFIDTLDIAIGDASGTRAYETYSGGEAFRIDFSIRLALAKLLSQRAGTPLQMLIVDEGFGTQDPEGCNRLVAAINAISSDFACILTVTHMPQFREAFQTRIEVKKTIDGSQLEVFN